MEVLAQTFKNILWQKKKKKKILKTTGTTYMLSGGVRAQILLQRHSAEENEENILVQYSLTCAWSDYFTVYITRPIFRSSITFATLPSTTNLLSRQTVTRGIATSHTHTNTDTHTVPRCGKGFFFSPSQLSVHTLSYGVPTSPGAIACISICAFVKVVHVRVRWIMETIKH